MRGKRQSLRVLGTFEAAEGVKSGSDDLVVMDISAVQERFGTPGKITRIDLLLSDRAAQTSPGGAVSAERISGDRGEAVQAALARVLPAGVAVERPSDRAARAESLLEAFHLNLQALSMLALIVGVFLVYNTLTVAVLQRRPLLGTLRCLGAESAAIRRTILLEAALLGALGAVLGLPLGTLLAGVFLERVGGTVNDVYVHIGALSVFFNPLALLKGFVLGVAAAVTGALVPALEAGRVAPVQVLRRSRVESGAQRAWKPLALCGLACFAAAAFLAWLPIASPVPGMVAAFLLALGGALVSPALTRAFAAFSRRPLEFACGLAGGQAARGVAANLSRTGLAVGALALALAMTVGVALMIASFRVTLQKWMAQSLHADVYMRPAGPPLLRHKTFLAEETLATLRARPDVDAVDTQRGRDVLLRNGSQVVVVCTDLPVTFSRGREHFPVYEGNMDEGFQRVMNGEVFVSEPFARKQNTGVGGMIELPTPSGWVSVRIAAVYHEYGNDRGVVHMDLGTYRKLYGDARANSAALYLKPGVDADAVRAGIQRTLGAEAGLLVFSNRSLRAEALKVFDRTFAITAQLETLALTVGLCGIVTALLAMLHERSREFALLRALGLSARGLTGIVILEGTLLGAFALLVGVVLGPALTWVLINVINVRAFGWTIFFTFDGWVFVRVTLLALCMGAVAGLYPAWKARRMNLAAALREE